MNVKELEVLSFKQVQELLGVSKSYLYKCTSQGKIPCYRPTKGKLFFKKKEVMDWIESTSGHSQFMSNLN
jgi:excisionase family DNA binding protein